LVPDASNADSSERSKRITEYVHNGLEGLALGSLLASSIFHLIPHAFELVGEDSSHHYLSKSLLIFLGIELFYISERLMVLFGDWQASRSRTRPPVTTNFAHTINGKVGLSPVVEEHEHSAKLCDCLDSHQKALLELAKKVPRTSSRSTLAWMVIFGDGLHNFIDGLSLGAALTDSHLTGFSIALAILFEEIPHELGDFTILLSSGMSRKQAALWNFASASSCYLGLVVGILVGDLSGSSCYIFAIAGGMFLYISLFDIMSELNERFNEARKDGIGSAFKVLMLQNLGILMGIGFLYRLAAMDEKSLLANFEIFW
jgi:zinc transporter ZupT